MAASFARKIPGADQTVASAIAMGLELGRPLYGATGEKFLQDRIANYRKSGLATTLTKAILSGLEGPRVNKIESGVQRVLDGAEDLTEEEKCAEGAVKMHDLALRSDNPPDVNDRLIGDTFKAIEESGTFTYPERYNALLNELGDVEQVEEIDTKKLNDLYTVYNYYMQNQGEMNSEFMKTVNGMPIEEKVAYYVVSIGEKSIEHVLAKNPRDIVE